MNTILLSKREQGFLNAARYTKKSGPQMGSYMVRDGYVVTTNGFTIHGIPVKNLADGHYYWNHQMDQLVKIDDAVFPMGLLNTTHDLFLSVPERLKEQQPMNILSVHISTKQYGLHLEHIASFKGVVSIGFRKGYYYGEYAAICIGMQCPVFSWQDEAVSVDHERSKETLYLDASSLKPVARYMAMPYTMRWNEVKKPCLFENSANWRAVIMPLNMWGGI